MVSSQSAQLIDITLDAESIGRSSRVVEHERQVAILDLLESNQFALTDHQGGPYKLRLSMIESRLSFGVSDAAGNILRVFMLSLGPFRKIVKDYFLICDSYREAIRRLPPRQIEAIDMGRRGVHDEGGRILMDRLNGKITIDFDTARRLFTLICALHWRG